MIELSLNDEGDLRSAFAANLVGRRLELMAGEPEATHPQTALASSWRKTSRSATRALQELRTVQSAVSRGAQDLAAQELEDAFKSLVYNAAEAFEVYLGRLPKRLEFQRNKSEMELIKTYRASGKRLRDLASRICNALKHNDRELLSGVISSQRADGATVVFRVNAAYGKLQKADQVVHKGQGFASYERTFHEILHSLLRVDHNAGRLVEALSDNRGPLIESTPGALLGLREVLSDLGSAAPFVASSEPRVFDGLELVDSTVRLTRVRGIPVPEPTRRIITPTVDAVARSIQLFA